MARRGGAGRTLSINATVDRAVGAVGAAVAPAQGRHRGAFEGKNARGLRVEGEEVHWRGSRLAKHCRSPPIAPPPPLPRGWPRGPAALPLCIMPHGNLSGCRQPSRRPPPLCQPLPAAAVQACRRENLRGVSLAPNGIAGLDPTFRARPVRACDRRRLVSRSRTLGSPKPGGPQRWH